MTIYCLDANVYIEGWTKYYSMELCAEYWGILDEFAKAGILFSTSEVKREIEKVDDALSSWFKQRPYFFREVTRPVQENLRVIMRTHDRLVDSTKQRSIADPWVIAHALAEGATVVTKEMPIGSTSSKRVKIPDVCAQMGVPYINDFELARRLGIKFSARVG